jgi:hypothetical protein
LDANLQILNLANKLTSMMTHLRKQRSPGHLALQVKQKYITESQKKIIESMLKQLAARLEQEVEATKGGQREEEGQKEEQTEEQPSEQGPDSAEQPGAWEPKQGAKAEKLQEGIGNRNLPVAENIILDSDEEGGTVPFEERPKNAGENKGEDVLEVEDVEMVSETPGLTVSFTEEEEAFLRAHDTVVFAEQEAFAFAKLPQEARFEVLKQKARCGARQREISENEKERRRLEEQKTKGKSQNRSRTTSRHRAKCSCHGGTPGRAGGRGRGPRGERFGERSEAHEASQKEKGGGRRQRLGAGGSSDDRERAFAEGHEAERARPA